MVIRTDCDYSVCIFPFEKGLICELRAKIDNMNTMGYVVQIPLTQPSPSGDGLFSVL